MFSLMVGAPGAARSLTDRPHLALGLSVAISLVIVWISIAASYETEWPIGFFVGVLGAVFFVAARAYASWRRSRLVAAAPFGVARTAQVVTDPGPTSAEVAANRIGPAPA
jgi:zinc/manganese transport system permease protein